MATQPSDATKMQGSPDLLTGLNRLFDRALRLLGEAGEVEGACQLAAQGWSLLRHERPADAERLNGTLHYLTHPTALKKAAARRSGKQAK